ncbi:sensor histidine kinase [Prauserella cavernicola]|uniref:histidine kinase n=1 Tax=Prauserella cavernicola TaxID=2800127 RepID=A0A934V2B5_9PSEU|nr:sensor histidine kinase [Prauserella cavernicola]MBK1785291.1 sensor histidine kinase [Prauserella cavernicola]
MPIALSSRARDAGLALGFAVLVVGATLANARLHGASITPLELAPLLAGCAALAVRRRHPVAVAAVTLAASAVHYATVEPDGPILLTFVVALYTVAAQGHLRAAVVLGGTALAATAYGEFATPVRHVGDAGLAMLAGWLVASIALGRARRTHVAYLHEAERRAATEERLRIARELHDTLGHHLSLITVQAGAALHRPDEQTSLRALTVIKQSSRDTLGELRSTLGVLRGDRPAPPGLATVDTLVEQARATGLTVTIEVDGERTELPPELDLTAYRLVQEALTNVRRHADASTATVRIHYARRELRVEVIDDGRGGTADPGHGIRGMSERVRLLGGDLSAGGRAGGGYRVSARLPAGALG